MSRKHKTIFGTPKPSKFGFWLSSRGESPMRGMAEYGRVYRDLCSWVRQYDQKVGLEGWEYYIRGDNLYGERIQHLEVVDSRILVPEFVSWLQSFLKKRSNRRWRIVCTDTVNPFCIYPMCVRFNRNKIKTIEEQLKAIRSRNSKRKSERKSRAWYRKNWLENKARKNQ
jgi:hypothetical protein